MPIPSEIIDLADAMRSWRRHLHQFPETAFAEHSTAEYISSILVDFGLDIQCGLAGTGIVASLSAGNSNTAIALRADMDALDIEEQNDFYYRSRNAGKMHACGHDGHSAMLLGAAHYLAQTRNFNGTVHFIFQPAEEGRAGAKQMLKDGLFDLFPVHSVFGMHNFPDIPAGHFAVKPGAMMAAFDCFEIQITGQGSHAAMPHLGKDPTIAAAQIITALQSIVSRSIDPTDAAVISITQMHAGNTWNAIPESVFLRGTSRCYSSSVQEQMKTRINELVQAICNGYGVASKITFNPENPGYPVTMNSERESRIAAQVAMDVVGAEHVDLQPTPSMGSEDFAFILQEKPGCYIWIGNGSSQGGCLLHNPHYDFNDEILPIGAAYWAKLVETVLA